jgi:hypothetical protein
MKLPVLVTPIAALILVLSTLGCSKKDDATPDPIVVNGSYKLDGVLKSCQVKADTTTFSTDPLHSFEQLQLSLITVPQPASGKESVSLVLTKPQGQARSAYFVTGMSYTPDGSNTGYMYNTASCTVTTTNSGGFSGTFSGKNIGFDGKPYSSLTPTITDGVFTELRPQ